MIDVEELKRKIISILNEKGPSLPIQIARAIETESVFASAILSELVNEKKIKLSNLKVGSSPLYLLENHEEKLENFTDNLKTIEKEAFLKLKQNKILEDEKQEPAIRVALRSIKDFAIPFRFQDKVYWRYFLITNEELNSLLKKPILREHKPIIKHEKLKEKPILRLKPKKEKKIPTRFLEEIKEFLLKKDIELIQEIKIDKKEIIAKARINSDLGKIIFLMIAKDKKRITKADLTMAYQQAINEKMPCLFLSRGDLSEKTQEFLEQYKNLLKIEKIH